MYNPITAKDEFDAAYAILLDSVESIGTGNITKRDVERYLLAKKNLMSMYLIFLETQNEYYRKVLGIND